MKRILLSTMSIAAIICSCSEDKTEKRPDVIGEKIVINEVMANNKSTQTSNDGKTQNWIEIANISNEPQSLKGYALVKDENERWECPDTTLQPNECLLVYATKKPVDGKLSCGFKLKSKHITLEVKDASGNIVSGIYDRKLKADKSLVFKDGKYEKTDNATPGKPNA